MRGGKRSINASGSAAGSGVVINKDQTVSVMINEEDHLRIQVLRSGFQLKKAWNAINALDTELEGRLDYAFSPRLGNKTKSNTKHLTREHEAELMQRIA